MKQIRITLEEANTFLDALHAKLKKSAVEDAFDMADWAPRGIVDVATIIRETVLEFEEHRLAANRKPKV